MTVTGPYALLILRSKGSVMVWSPPMVITLGRVLPARERPISSASVKGLRMRRLLWPASICWMAQLLSNLINISV